MYFTTTVLALAGLASMVSASPIVAIEKRQHHPYFNVTNFSYSKSSTSARYALNITFPEYVVISPSDPNSATYTIPGFTNPVACTGTWFNSTNGPSTTAINACGALKNPKAQAVTTQFDTATGDLIMTYQYNVTVNGQPQSYTWKGTQGSLKPVAPANAQSFTTLAYGPSWPQ